MIFNMLAQNSDRLACKLLHIVFDARHFVESMVENKAGNSVDIASKLKNLMLSKSGQEVAATGGRRKGNSGNPGADKNSPNNVIVNFYLKTCEFSKLEMSKFLKSSAVITTTLKFIFNLFKVNSLLI